MENYDKSDVYGAAFDRGMVKFQPNNPFELTSGKPSPVYINGRLWTGDQNCIDTFLGAMEKETEDLDYELLAGGVTAGVPYSERLAQKQGKPTIYVRKEPKGHGIDAQIEGSEDLEGDIVLLVEDLITTGGSKINFIDGIETANGKVNDCLAFFDREQGGREDLSEIGVELHSVATMQDLLDYGVEAGRIDEEEYESMKKYLEDPEAWEESFLERNPDWK